MSNSHPLDNTVYDVLTIVQANPAPGANFTITVPDNERFQILGLRFALVNTSDAADRLIRINFNDGTTDHPIINVGRIQVATETISYNFAPGYTFQNSVTDFDSIDQHFPNDVILTPRNTIDSDIANLQAGDQLAVISIRVKRWITE